MLIITAYFDDLDMDTYSGHEEIKVVINGIEYIPDITSSIGSD